MPPARIALCALLLALGLPASDEPLFSASFVPARGRHVPDPVRLGVTLERVDPEGMRFILPQSLRLSLDGVDATVVFLQAVLAGGAVRWDPEGARLTLEAAAPLPPGPHRLELTARTTLGGRLRWHAEFCVYTPERALPLRQRLLHDQPGALLLVEDFDPPEIAILPADGAFLHTGAPRLEVKWSDALAWVDPSAARILLDNRDVTALFAPAEWGGVYQVPVAAPLAGGRHVLVVQARDALGNLGVASSSFLVLDDAARAPWPFAPVNQPHTLGHTHHQYQRYGTAASSAYFHHGVDIMPAAQAPLYACRGGMVEAFYWYGDKPYYFEVAIRDADGFLWQYHHVDEPTIPQAVRDAFANKTPLAAGAHLGNIVFWPSSAYGVPFHHVHLNVLDRDGNYANPLHFLLKHADTQAPAVGEILFARNGSTTALNSPTGPTPVLSGALDIIARAEDLAGGSFYQLTLYEMEWSVRELGNSMRHHVPPTPLWLFDRLPVGPDRYAHVHTVFQYSIYYDGSTKRTAGDYSTRRFFYNLTNTVAGFPDPVGAWDSAARDVWGRPLFPNGFYRVTVGARDEAGNKTEKYVDVEVRN